jgi:hypothetical protein
MRQHHHPKGPRSAARALRGQATSRAATADPMLGTVEADGIPGLTDAVEEG